MYTELSKVFYSNNADYEITYKKRYDDPYSIHLDFVVAGHPVFFLQLPELLNKIINIRRIDKSIHMISNEIPGVALDQFVIRCLIDEIEITNGIEGVHSSRREISAILSDLRTEKANKRLWGIVHKYLMLMNKETIEFGSCEDIRNIFDELVSAEIEADDPKDLPDGKIFRKDSTSVQTATQREIHRGVFPESAIISSMERALAILKDETIEIFFRIALFHYFFGYIHPFYDGNGRVSRFISSYLLSRELESIVGYRLSYTIRDNLSEYNKAFEICNHPNNRGDLTPFLIMFIGVIEKSMILLRGALEKRKSEYKIYLNVIPYLHNGTSEKYKPIYDLLIQASLFSDEGIPTSDLMRVLNISSRGTLRTRLDGLEKGLLKVDKKRENYYQIDLAVLNLIMKELAERDNDIYKA